MYHNSILVIIFSYQYHFIVRMRYILCNLGTDRDETVTSIT